MKEFFINQWRQLQTREQWIVGIGSVIVGLIFFYVLILHPWHRAINNMTGYVQTKRIDLTFMRQQAEIINNGEVVDVKKQVKASGQSLLSVIEQTARSNKLSKAIQQMAPSSNVPEGVEQVSVVLEEAEFNQWVKWVDVLYKDYAVNIKQVSAESETDEPNIVGIRVTFERG